MDSCITSPRCPVMVNCLPPRMRVASMKTMSPPAGVQTSPTETPGCLTRSSTSRSARNLRNAQGLVHDFGRDHQLVGFALRHAARLFPRDRGDFAFEIPHASLPRVAVDDFAQSVVGELDLLAHLQPVFGGLLRDQVLVGDVDLLDFGITRQLDDLHAVAQRLGNRIDPVGRGDEQNLRKIERHVEIVIAESRVLLRIENLHQRRRRIAAEIAAELIHFVEHEHRIVGFGSAQSLNDLARQRADIGAAVAADFGFVMHAAEGDAHELASERASDGFAERGLAHAWRPDEAEDRALHSRL